MQKKITLDLTSIDGNAYMLLGSFKTQAHREKWTPQEIEAVLSEAIKRDYDHLVGTLAKHCESEEDQIDDEWSDRIDDDWDESAEWSDDGE